MGIILDKINAPDIGHLKKNLTLAQIISEAPVISKTHVSTNAPPLGRIGLLDNQHANKGLSGLISAAKSMGRQAFNGIHFYYLKLFKN